MLFFVWCWWATTKNIMCFNPFQIYDNIAEKGCVGSLNCVAINLQLLGRSEGSCKYSSSFYLQSLCKCMKYMHKYYLYCGMINVPS